MPSSKPIIAIPADPDDPDDFDVTEAELQRVLAERRTRVAGQEGTGVLLDADVLAKFRATGPGWQTRINEALRAAEV